MTFLIQSILLAVGFLMLVKGAVPGPKGGIVYVRNAVK